MNWQPIETAPDTSIEGFLVCRAGKSNSAMHVFRIDGVFLAMNSMTRYVDPTHWMPLPEPPEQEVG